MQYDIKVFRPTRDTWAADVYTVGELPGWANRFAYVRVHCGTGQTSLVAALGEASIAVSTHQALQGK